MTPERTLELADHCVKCGLCLPHCPTYRLTADESESPRGRIALVQGWLGGALPGSAALFGHLDRCLECRACELACPSGVAYGTLLDSARAHQRAHAGPLRRGAERIALEILSRPAGLRLLGYGAAVARGLGALRVASWLALDRSRWLGPYLRLLPFLSPPPHATGAGPLATDTERTLNLFLGCVGRISQPRALEAATRLLARLGWRVRIPPDQRCCGALFRHNGFPEQADRLLAQNASALAQGPNLAIASACAAELRFSGTGLPVEEICAFLGRIAWPETLSLRPLGLRVAVHEPCSHRHPLGDTQAVYALLGRIPEIRLETLPENAFCCGAAGNYLIRQPKMSARLLADKLRWLREQQPQILATTNTGCALHLAAGIREVGLAIEVCHPVELLARQLPAADVRAVTEPT